MGCIALTLWLKSIRVFMFLFLSLFFFWQNCIGYWMHKTHLKIASFLVSVIMAKVAKIDTSFLIYPFWVRGVRWVVLFLVTVEVYDLKYIFTNFAVSANDRGRWFFFDSNQAIDQNINIFSSFSKFFCPKLYCFWQTKSWTAFLPVTVFWLVCCKGFQWRKYVI